MTYHNTKTIKAAFDDAITRITDELKKEGFGVLTEIDVKDTLKKKLGEDFRNYKILGACNPLYAFRALQAEENIGVMLPCNVVVQEKANGLIQVSAINPMAAIGAINNNSLIQVAEQVSKKLNNVLNNL